MIRPEDKHIVIAIAVQMWCARMQSHESKRDNGESRNGYSPDSALCVGEAVAMLNLVNLHLPPEHREVKQERRRQNHHGRQAVELTFRREIE